MDESILYAEKEVLVAVVKMAQKQMLKGDKGDWKEFLSVHDRKMGISVRDPAKRSIDDLVSFLKTFSDEGIQKFLAKVVRSLSERKSLAQLTKTPAEDDSPQQRLIRLTLDHPAYLLNYTFPSQNEEWAFTTLGKASKAVKSNVMVAVDCEMVLCQDGTEAVVKVCVVDENMEVKLNELVNPNKAVADYRTKITGISAEDLEGVTCSLANIQKKMKKLLRKGTILVGHSLYNDLRALKLNHARVIDTSYIFDNPVRRRPSLNDLCKTVLGYEVRKDGAPHNCLDDAQAAMKLILAKLEGLSDGSIARAVKDVPESELAKLLIHGIPRGVPQEELLRIFPDFSFELQPRSTFRKQHQKYSVIAVFKDPKEAHEAFESIERQEEKDSAGYPQKLVILELSTGFSTTVSVRKMVLDDPHTVVDKKGNTPSKRSGDAESKDGVKKAKIESSQCEDHIKEIERLTKELRARDDEVSSMQKILTALTRKQGL